ncbi:PP2C family serine/threonine-protein phosphatase [Rugamonas sp.]|uniref:PP2C family protein-serine/threonine phosphatase n=1 Tax=Rugamonas sp. TaxID=1926287 RepID=UPI0025E89D69|nr:protein phosphatase 2C domain-containing protein [Rugamonas sp.]
MTSLSDTLAFGAGLDVAADSRASVSRLQAPENQDNFVLIDAAGRAVYMRDQRQHSVQLDGWPRGHVRLAVLDGMGGHGQGREAAEAVAAGLLLIPACDSIEELSARLDALHSTLQMQFRQPGDNDDFRRPGTTLTLLELAPDQAPLLYHVGDSRLYEITAAEVRPLTIDHVPATSFALHGLLGAQEWWQQVHGEHRAQISQAFILGNAFANPQVLDNDLLTLDAAHLPPFLRQMTDRRALAVRHDAVYLLATDGFWACPRPQNWIARWPALLGRPERRAAATLAALFGEFCDHPPADLHVDNLTAIVIRFPSRRPDQNDNIDETALPNHR